MLSATQFDQEARSYSRSHSVSSNLKRQRCRLLVDSVEKVRNGSAAQISANRIDIYNRLPVASQFHLERCTSRRGRTMRPSASLFRNRPSDAEKIDSPALTDFFNRIDSEQTSPTRHSVFGTDPANGGNNNIRARVVISHSRRRESRPCHAISN